MKHGSLKKVRNLLPLALVAPLLFLSPSLARAQTSAIAKGRAIEKVISKSDAGQSYALYLPTAYTPDKKWPLLLAFDPAARGALAVERFKEAAEKFGYVVMGSNNSRNGAASESSAALRAMWTDATAIFSIDERRVYATGFSGGARVAVSVGYALKGVVAGVVGCGAGFPQSTVPPGPVPFAYFGTVGLEDFNYGEMKALEKRLRESGVAHRIELFEGGHDWASSELCVRAIEWMELQAIKSARRGPDEKLVEEIFKREVDRARSLEAGGDVYKAYVSYDALARDFKGLKEVGELEAKAARLKESKEVRQAARDEERQQTEQDRRVRELFRLRARAEGQDDASGQGDGAVQNDSQQASAAESKMQARAELRRVIAELRSKGRAKDNGAERLIARRSFSLYSVSSYERAQSFLRAGKYYLAITSFTVDAETMPDAWQPFYNLACAYSLSGDRKRAIDALRKAMQKGFAEVALLEANKDLDALRAEPEFKKIVEEMGGKQG